MYKGDLALNNLQGLICHTNQTKPNQTPLHCKQDVIQVLFFFLAE